MIQGCVASEVRPMGFVMQIEAMQSVPIMAAQQIVQHTLPALERRLDEAIILKPQAIGLVMAAVQIIDSAGLTWLLSMQERLETLGIRMRLVDPSPIMSDVLLATRLDARFTVEFAGGDGGAHGANGHSRTSQAPKGHEAGGGDGR